MHLIPAPGAGDWAKSTYSSGEGGNGVEWAPGLVESHGVVPVRDSKLTDRPLLGVSSDGWRAFVRHVRAGWRDLS